LGILDGIPGERADPQMSVVPRHTVPGKVRLFWLREQNVLATLAAFLAFAIIYAYSGDADLYYPLAGALGMGATIHAAVWMATHRKG
jgi:hypothetical protein